MTSQFWQVSVYCRVAENSSYVKTETELISQYFFKWNHNQLVVDSERVLSLHQISIVDITCWFTVVEWLVNALVCDASWRVHNPASPTCQTLIFQIESLRHKMYRYNIYQTMQYI